MPRKKPLEEFQSSLWKLLASEEQERLGERPRPLDLYEKEYRKDVEARGRRCSLATLARSIARAEIVLVGDDHAVAESRDSFLFLLERVLRHKPRLAIGLEMVRIDDQKILDAFLAGDMGDAEFLRATRYWERWGFDWESYRKILHFAKENRLPVLALNREYRGEQALHRRDEKAAERIVSFSVKNPSTPCFVLFGEQHVSESHLPRRIEEALRRESAQARVAVVHQNSTLGGSAPTENGRLRVHRLAERTFWIQSASPLAALSSHLAWLDGASNPGKNGGDREELRALLLDRTHTVALALSVLLEQESAALDRFEILLEEEAKTGLEASRAAGASAESLEHLEWEARTLPIVAFPGTPYLLLRDTSFPGVCEGAGQLLARAEGSAETSPDIVIRFCRSAFRAGLGFFSSKLFDPYRVPRSPFAWIERPNAQGLAAIRGWKECFRDFLLQPQELSSFVDSLRSLPETHRFALARATGEAFGGKLYRSFASGTIQAADLQEIFRTGSGSENRLLSSFLGFLRRVEDAKAD